MRLTAHNVFSSNGDNNNSYVVLKYPLPGKLIKVYNDMQYKDYAKFHFVVS